MGIFVRYIQNPIDSLIIYIVKLIFGKSQILAYLTHDWWEERVDPRTKDYAFVDISGASIAALLLIYLLLVLYIIPKWMENRKPYDLKYTIICYDVILVVINGYFFLYSVFHIKDMFDFSDTQKDVSEKAMKFINTAHLYYLSKILDLLDTIFMALKKKKSHITFLHVWHHFSMPGGGWMFMKYNSYMPVMYLLPLFNGFVHVVMYGYYALAAFGPQMQKYLWWKKYITQMQLIQFTFGLIWVIYFIIKMPHLSFYFKWLNFLNDLALFLLFANFYLKSYSKPIKHNKSQ